MIVANNNADSNYASSLTTTRIGDRVIRRRGAVRHDSVSGERGRRKFPLRPCRWGDIGTGAGVTSAGRISADAPPLATAGVGGPTLGDRRTLPPLWKRPLPPAVREIDLSRKSI